MWTTVEEPVWDVTPADVEMIQLHPDTNGWYTFRDDFLFDEVYHGRDWIEFTHDGRTYYHKGSFTLILKKKNEDKA